MTDRVTARHRVHYVQLRIRRAGRRLSTPRSIPRVDVSPTKRYLPSDLGLSGLREKLRYQACCEISGAQTLEAAVVAAHSPVGAAVERRRLPRAGVAAADSRSREELDKYC